MSKQEFSRLDVLLRVQSGRLRAYLEEHGKPAARGADEIEAVLFDIRLPLVLIPLKAHSYRL